MPRLDLHRRYQLGRLLGKLAALAIFLSRPFMLALLITPPLVVGGIKLAGLAGELLLRSEFASQLERSTAVEIIDRAGVRFVLPGILEYADYSDGSLYPPDHRSRTPEVVPDSCWQILVALEDRRRGTIYHVGGIDLLAVMALPRDFALGRRRGASTIEMQLLRSTYNLLPATGWISDTRRKIMEFALTPSFARFIERRGGEPLLAQLAMTHLPMAIVPGGTLHGIVETADVVFDKRPEDLTLAECAYLMASVRFQIRLGDKADASAHSRRLARARYGLLLGVPESPARRRSLDRLDHMPAPVLSRSTTSIATDPQQAAIRFARGEMVEILGELSDFLGPRRLKAHIVESALAIHANYRRKIELEAVLAEIERTHHQNLTLPLVHGPRAQRAQIFVAGTSGDGALTFYYNNQDDAILSGSKQTRDHLGRFRVEAETRAIGSLGKAILALPLAHRFEVDALVCNRSIASGSVRNADGDRGSKHCDATSLIDLRTAFAKSLNLPLIEACRTVPTTDLKSVLRAWRANLPPDLRSHEQLCRWVVLQAVVAPSHLLAGFHALGRALLMNEPAIARIPRLIKTITWRNPTDGSLLTANMPDRKIDLSPYLDNQRVRTTVRQWLSAPISEQGTAHSISHLGLPAIAKTGTVSLRNGRVRDQWLLASLKGSTELRSFLFLAGASHPSIPLEFPSSDRLFGTALGVLLRDFNRG